MSYRETFTKFSVDLSKLNENELTVVVYNPSDHTLTYSQVGYVFIASYLSPFFKPKKGFRVGVLSQRGLNTLRYQLAELLKNEAIDKMDYIPSIEVLGTGWYRQFIPSEYVPHEFIKLNYCNITSKILTWFTCRFFNENSRLLYKIVNTKPKSNGKVISDTTVR